MKPKKVYIIGYQKIFFLFVIENIRRSKSDINNTSNFEIYETKYIQPFKNLKGYVLSLQRF